MMAQSPALKVHEVCSVAPPQGTTPTSLPLTFFDIIWLRLPPVERLFFYEFPNPPTSFFDSVLPNLKDSLEFTLQHFVPLAGNITWPLDSPTPIITYVPGDSVPLTIAEYNEDFNHLCSNLCEVSKRHPLVPRLSVSDNKAFLLALQVTLFPNSGFVIGITTHHAAVDGKCSTLFMKAWAYACSEIIESPSLSSISSLPEHLTPSFDRSVIRDPKGITEAYVDSWLNYGGPNNRSLKVWETINEAQTEAVKGTFELTPSHIQKLKQYAQSKLKVKVSTFTVTVAYLLSCLVKAEQPESNRVAFIFSVDCRSRLDPPLVPTYFGNCIMAQLLLDEKEKLLGSDGFINALKGITDLLNGLENGVLNEAENWMSKVQSAVGEGNKLYSTAGSPRFEVYSIDFGWGRPRKVDVTSVDRTGAFALSEGRNIDGGVEIGLALNKQQMEAFASLFAQELESFQCF